MRIIGIPEGEEREKVAESLFKEIIAEGTSWLKFCTLHFGGPGSWVQILGTDLHRLSAML